MNAGWNPVVRWLNEMAKLREAGLNSLSPIGDTIK